MRDMVEGTDGLEEMTVARRERLVLLARLIGGFIVFGFAIGIWLTFLDKSNGGGGGDIMFGVVFSAFPIAGYLVATRRPENSIGWLMLGIGTALGVGSIASSYGSYAIDGGVGGRHLGEIAAAIDSPMWVPAVALPATFLILLFPDGHLPSPRWRWFARVLGAGLVIIVLAIILSPGELGSGTEAFAHVRNPLGVESLRPILTVALASLVMLPIGAIAALVSLVQRFRRSEGIERLQLRWLVTAAAIVAVLYTVSLLIGWAANTAVGDPGWLGVIQSIAIMSFILIPIAIAVSVLRYHLFDIDVVINRALLFGTIALFITAVYVGIVVGIGALVGSRGDPLLSAIAAGIIAIAFQPVRSRAQRFADRLVYGERAEPYEVLSEFSERLGNAYANEELLPRMARALAGGTGAVRADVWVRLGDELVPEASWPHDAESLPSIAAADDDTGEVSPSAMREPIRHQGELLGALSIVKRPGESLTPTEEKLVRDLAGQAGLVMRNVALTEQLMDHIDQLRASRQRLVNAQDEERRKLERNLHDGAQQQLVALSVQLRLAEGLVDRDPERTKSMLANLQTATGQAIEDLRDLARGHLSAAPGGQGLGGGAGGAGAQGNGRRRRSKPKNVARYPQQVEAAVYFCALEALNNVAKYAGASRAEVRLAQSNGDLTFEVSDDGAGFDVGRTSYGTGLRGMADRVEAIGGTLEIRSTPGEGTSVAGRIPVSAVSELSGPPSS